MSAKRRQLLESCLEAARQEVLRRLRERNLPTSTEIQRLVVKDNPNGTGWGTDWELIRVSSLAVRSMELEILDSSIPGRAIGLRCELLPLAEFLHQTTDLGQERPAGMYPAMTGPDAVIGRYLSPMAVTYLADLTDIARPKATLVEQIATELDLLCDPTTIVHRSQLLVEGLRVRRRLGPYRQVSLRPLSPAERGAIVHEQHAAIVDDRPRNLDLIIPRPFSTFSPTSLLEIRTKRNKSQRVETSQLPNRVALAFYLAGFDIAAPGLLVGFDEPRWAGVGTTFGPFQVTERSVAGSPISKKQFEAVIDLAHKMPEFGGEEGSAKEIALHRVLSACGSTDSVEAALLEGEKTELAYRFRLYGSLFLRSKRAADETFEKLKNIYTVRSNLVHGSRVRVEARRAAERDAADLARLTIRKAVEEGWPRRQSLDQLALDR